MVEWPLTLLLQTPGLLLSLKCHHMPICVLSLLCLRKWKKLKIIEISERIQLILSFSSVYSNCPEINHIMTGRPGPSRILWTLDFSNLIFMDSESICHTQLSFHSLHQLAFTHIKLHLSITLKPSLISSCSHRAEFGGWHGSSILSRMTNSFTRWLSITFYLNFLANFNLIFC